MNELLLAGVGLLAIMGTWRFVWRLTVLDTARDTLFDLRDNTLRSYFAANNLSLDNPTYVNLRSLLNGHLRHTESLSIGEYAYMKTAIEKHPDLSKKITENINQKFRVDDPDLQKLVDEIRYKSSVAMITYMIESSLVSMIVGQIILLIVLIRHLPVRSIFVTKPVVKARAVMEHYALAT